MIEGKWFAQGCDLTVPLAIREAALGTTRDAVDEQAQQVVVSRAGMPVGTARLWWSDGAFWAGDVCVLPTERGQGYGDLLVRLLLYKAATHGAKMVLLTCPASLTPFFERYGFTARAQEDPCTLCATLGDDGTGCAGCGGCGGNAAAPSVPYAKGSA